jgi:hypothetical protein
MTTPTKPHRSKTAASRRRDVEMVQNGLNGYLQIASSLAYRYYRHQLVLQDDREQAAALAALEAYSRYSADFTLREVTKVIRAVLYRQAKAYGYRMVNTRREDGSRTAGWTNYEIPFSRLPNPYSRIWGLAGI